MNRASKYVTAAKALRNSIARGTQHFDRDHAREVLNNCLCAKTVNPACPVHKNFKTGCPTLEDLKKMRGKIAVDDAQRALGVASSLDRSPLVIAENVHAPKGGDDDG